MTKYIVSRLAHGIVVVFGAYTLAFVVLDVIPGNPVQLMLANGGDASFVPTAQIQKISAQYGFNKPLIVQYLVRLGHMFKGNLGASIQTGQSVSHLIAQALPPTLELAGAALFLGVVFGVIVGFFGTFTRNRVLRGFLLALPSFGAAMPSFWIGLILIELFSFRIHLFPAFGTNGFLSLVLPAVTLSLTIAPLIGQVLATSMSKNLREPYVETARSKGASRLHVHLFHVARNAIAPAVTIAGVVSGRLVAGAVIVETVFGRNGLGALTVNAVETKDFGVVQGVVVCTAVAYVLASLVVDLLYLAIDPRLAIRRPAIASSLQSAKLEIQA